MSHKMVLSNYSRVRLLTNHYIDEGVKAGDSGFIIEIYNADTRNPGYEVEFSRNDGTTIAMIVLRQEEIELAEEKQ